MLVSVLGGCSTPRGAFLGVGRSVEVGLVGPMAGPRLQWEASGAVATDRGADHSSRVRPVDGAVPGLEGDSRGTFADDVVARLGWRLSVCDWAHVGGGLSTAWEGVGPYLRVGIEQRLGRSLAVGVEGLLEDDASAALTLRWSR